MQINKDGLQQAGGQVCGWVLYSQHGREGALWSAPGRPD